MPGDYLMELAGLMAIFSLAVISPGADLAMVIRQSLLYGRRAAILTSFGIGTALMLHVTYTVLGLGLIISQSILLFNVVKWCGVAYLVYIGVMALKAGKTSLAMQVEGAPRPVQPASRAFALGFAANALNPKAVFFFLSIFSTVVSAATPMAVKFGYGLAMAVVLIAWFIGVSLFLTTPKMRAAFERAGQWIERVSGLVFILLGIKLASQRAG